MSIEHPPTTERPAEMPSDTTHFGFKTVLRREKAGFVRGVFDDVANRYDLMNDLMSLGTHRLWKSAMIDWLNPRQGQTVLDVGGGTGDIAERIRRRGSNVIVLDINEKMLVTGRDRLVDRASSVDIAWACGDAERLPVTTGSMDAYTTAFCMRNVTNVDLALLEARRVLKPGGRFLCLEFSSVVLPILDQLYDQYSFKVLPTLGSIVARNRDAYEYLAESIRKFPPQRRFSEMIQAAGFSLVRCRNLSGGIVALHSAWRT